MSAFKNNVLDDYDEVMDFGYGTAEDLISDLKILKIRDRIAELQKENTKLKKQIENYRQDCENCVHIRKCKYLEDKLADIKYLDRDTIDLILHRYGRAILDAKSGDKKLCEIIKEQNLDTYEFSQEIDKAFKNSITTICSLAIKPITKEKIIKAIKKYGDKINYPVLDRNGKYVGSSGHRYELDKSDLGKIASEILGEDKEELK